MPILRVGLTGPATDLPREQIMNISMRFKLATIALFATGSVISCGGGGGGGALPAPTSISGSVTPVSSLPAAQPPQSLTMVLAPNAPQAVFPTIAQTLDYSFDPNEPTDLKVTALNFARPIDTAASFTLSIGSTALPGDPLLGQPNGITVQTNRGIVIFPPVGPITIDTLGSLPAFLFDMFSTSLVGYVIPFSASANPGGFVYQTFGSWLDASGILGLVEGYFSAGIPVDASTLSSSGSATYNGTLSASMVEAVSRDPFDVIATLGVTVNFATRTVTFTTTGTTALSANAAAASPFTSRPDLNMQGMLTYEASSNTYSGTVSAANGMTGNVTGRLYGAGAPPPEVGGTFALKLEAVGAMQGAFGGK
jgi:hypothetical protein